MFQSKNQLEVDEKTHEKFDCEDCYKIFNYKGHLERHIEAVHSDPDMIIFCHNYNNRIDCPFEDSCIFEHDQAEICRYGKDCERQMCMYTHDDDGSVRTFEIKTETGNVTLRNARHLRHQTKKKDVSFAMSEPGPDGAAESDSSGYDSSTSDTSHTAVTMPVPEPRRVSERLARKENRF